MLPPDTNWRPTGPTLIAGCLVLLGILMTVLSWWFLLLVAAGALGPGVLRELGWLRDRDEFQQLAAYRAGYHAYLAGALVAFALVAFFRSGDRVVEFPQELATLFLVLLWFTWFLSSLISFWGARKAAFRILVSFGLVWLVFTIVSNTGSEWRGWKPLLLHPLLTLPFFALAWLSRRWPRIAGVLLLATGAFAMHFFGMFRSDHLAIVNQAVTFVLFIGPLIASGLALVASTTERDDTDDGDDTAEPDDNEKDDGGQIPND
jgi:glucan phosphoethanolaminetransferase (alkaline phosphatase superfamily)